MTRGGNSSSGEEEGSDVTPFTPVQLGFAQDIDDDDDDEVDPSLYLGHNHCDWRSWDGGQIGGSPSWLNPRDLPKEPMKCPDCKSLMKFVTQIYAPVNDEDSFHRTLYVFACPSSLDCQNGVVVLRSQLSQVNDFYPEKCPDDTDDEYYDSWDKHLCTTWDVKTCTICHQRASGGKCPKSQKWFCSREHQLEFYAAAKKSNHSKDMFPSVLRKMELVVEEEPPEVELTEDKDPLFETKEGDEDDANLEQEDLNQMVGMKDGGTADEDTMDFYARISRAGGSVKDQILRYQRWPESKNDGPLWISSKDKGPMTPPACPYCGAERRFEFQILPQMLHFLLHPTNSDNEIEILSAEQKQAFMAASDILERNDLAENDKHDKQTAELKERHDQILEQYKEGLGLTTKEKQKGKKERLDWGTIAVYTCTASCSGEVLRGDDNETIKNLGAYRLEYAWRQPGLD